jgi:hypothetical protein
MDVSNVTFGDITVVLGKSKLIEKFSERDFIYPFEDEFYYLPESGLSPFEIPKYLLPKLQKDLNNNNKILIVTHSSFVLEMLHVYSKYAQEYEKAINKELFQKKAKNKIKRFISTPFDFTGKTLKVYHLTGKGFRDISDLEEDGTWGGLASFTMKAADAYLGISDINRKMK